MRTHHSTKFKSLYFGLRSILLCVSLCIFCLNVITTSRAVEFEIEGVFKASLKLDNHKYYHVPGKPFKISVLDDQWMIQIITNNKHDAPDLTVVSSDGVDIYQLRTYSKEVIKRSETVNTHNQYGRVNAGIFPLGLDTTAKMLWISYASSKYFKGITNNLMKSVGYDTVDNYDHIRYTLTSLNKDCLMPETLDMYYPGTCAIITTNGTNYATYPEPFNKEYLKYELRAISNSVINNIKVPTCINILAYGILTNNGSASHEQVAQCSLFVTNISNRVSISGFLPKISQPANLVDERFSRLPLAYIEMNNNWLSRSDIDITNTVKTLQQP